MKHFHFFLCALFLLRATFSQAETLGHAEFEIKPPWEILTKYETALSFNGGEYKVTMDNLALYIPGDNDVPKAILVLTGVNASRGRKIRWVSEICPQSRKNYFTEDFGSNQQADVKHCLIVNTNFAPFVFFKPDAEVIKSAQEKGLKIFKSGYSIRSVYANQSSLFRVNLMTTKNFKGLSKKPQHTEFFEVNPDLIALGEALDEAVSDVITSFSGSFTLPTVEFTN
jgi:hypothetical protein